MSILSSLSRYTAEYRARRRRMRAYMEIASLPAEIRKDIGWSGVENRSETPALRRVRELGR